MSMTFASVSSQGALLRPRSPSSARRNRPAPAHRHILHFHFKDPSAVNLPAYGSYITLAQTPNSGHSSATYYTSQLFLPQPPALPSASASQSQRTTSGLVSSFRASGIPRSSSGLYPASAGRPVSGIVLHPVSFVSPIAPAPPPQSILVLPGSARSRIRQHQAKEDAVRRKSIHNPEGLSDVVESQHPVKRNKMAAATAVHLSSPPPSSTSTPHHIHHHIAPTGYHSYSGYYAQQNGRGSPTVIVTDSVSHIHPAEHFTPTRPTIGYPGGAHGTNQVVIRVIQKPVEALMVDGDNPFRPDTDLYKEADELIKAYTLPRGSAAPSPMPVSSASSGETHVSTHFPILAQPGQVPTETQVKDQRSTTITSSSSSSAPSSVSSAKEVEQEKMKEKEENNKENVHHQGVSHPVPRPRVARPASPVEPDRPEEHHPEHPKKPDNSVVHKKDGKKKRKPVGCGGDKRCTIM